MGQLKVRKPHVILFDLVTTATKSHFTDKILFPYVKYNCRQYLEQYWTNGVVQKDIERLREQSEKDNGPRIASSTQDPDTIRKSVTDYVSACLDDVIHRDSDALSIFRLHMIFDGYNKDKLITPVYSDVAIQIRHWAVDLHIKLYVFSNGWSEATKRFMSKTNHGNLNLLIEGHFDNTDGSLTSTSTYEKILTKVGDYHPEEVLFLTHSVKEGLTAKKSALSTLLVLTHRRDVSRGMTQEEAEGIKQLPYIRSFNDLVFTSDSPPASSLAPGSASDDGSDNGEGGNASNERVESKSAKSINKSKNSSKTNKSKSASGAKTKSVSAVRNASLSSNKSSSAVSSNVSKASSSSTNSSSGASATSAQSSSSASSSSVNKSKN